MTDKSEVMDKGNSDKSGIMDMESIDNGAENVTSAPDAREIVDNGANSDILHNTNSGAPAARRAAKRNPIIIEKGTTRMHRNRNPCNSFLMVKMASGMDHGRVRPTSTTTTTNDVAQHGGHLANTKSCSLGLKHISLILDIHTMFN